MMKKMFLLVCVVLAGCSINKTIVNLAIRPNEIMLSLDYSKCTPKYLTKEEYPPMKYEKH